MTVTMSLGSQIQSVYPNLTKSERKAADYILKHMEGLGTQTLAQMSKTARVGEATIMRFIYKLGYEIKRWTMMMNRRNPMRSAYIS